MFENLVRLAYCFSVFNFIALFQRILREKARKKKEEEEKRMEREREKVLLNVFSLVCLRITEATFFKFIFRQVCSW